MPEVGPLVENETILQQVEKALATGRFCIALFRVEDGQLSSNIHLRDYPHDRFLATIATVQNRLTQEIRRTQEQLKPVGGHDGT
jgi:hypothetical protein